MLLKISSCYLRIAHVTEELLNVIYAFGQCPAQVWHSQESNCF